MGFSSSPYYYNYYFNVFFLFLAIKSPSSYLFTIFNWKFKKISVLQLRSQKCNTKIFKNKKSTVNFAINFKIYNYKLLCLYLPAFPRIVPQCCLQSRLFWHQMPFGEPLAESSCWRSPYNGQINLTTLIVPVSVWSWKLYLKRKVRLG